MKEFKTEYRDINSKQILIDDDYQRTVNYARVKRIVADYNPNLVNPIKVSYRGGKYYAFDGQHTLAVKKTMNNNKDLLVACKVYFGMTKEEEAELFAQQNGLSRQVTSNQKLKSLYIAKDVDVVDFKKCVEECGLVCDFSSSSGNKKLICYSTAFQIYMKHGEKHLQKILKIIIRAWNGEKDSLMKEIIQGLDMFIRTYTNEYDENHLCNRLSRVSPISIKRDGSVSSSGGAKRFAVQIYDIYCKNTSTGRLEYKF